MPVPLLPLPNARGVSIPGIGYGVGTAWYGVAGTGGDRAAALSRSVTAALDAGFRYIDEAEMYENEAVTGPAVQAWLRRTGRPRGELFVVSKAMSVEEPGVRAVCERSLRRLGVGYFDLYLIHAPFRRDGAPFRRPLRELWAEMEALVDAGLARAVGVSNWRVRDLEQLAGARIPPACNQVEAHPYLQQQELLQYCKAKGIVVTAYSPLAPLTQPALRGGAADAAVRAAAARAGRTPAQVLLRWCMQTGRGVVTTTGKEGRLAEFLAVADFELPAADVHAITVAGAGDPERAGFRGYWAKQFARADAAPKM